ncbi:hypothetical protein EK21DRAFT_70634, partial [Setomelanomma holmii]
FMAQLIGRVSFRLTVTPLELFTLGYVVCAFGMYYRWWHKPFDIHTCCNVRTISRTASQQLENYLQHAERIREVERLHSM